MVSLETIEASAFSRWRLDGQTLLLSLLLGLVCFLVLTPVLWTLFNSFQVSQPWEPTVYGLDGWKEAFSSPGIRQAIYNSFSLTITRQLIALVMGILLAWVLARTDIPGKGWMELMFWFSFFIPALPVTLGWILALDPKIGIINGWLAKLPFVDGPLFNIYSFWGIVWAHLGHNTTAIKVMLLTPAFRNMDASLEEASRVSGASTIGTLARILGGTEPFEGERKLGQRVDIGFFAQNQSEALNAGDTVLQAMQRAAYGWDEARIRGLLGAFLFSADDVLKRTSVLSGGEKSRLALALTLATPANLLILDEPTNHLDIRSRAALIEALREFPGTFVVISHDRHFVDSVANRIWYVADGQVRVYHGNYSGIVQLQATATRPEPKTRPEVEPTSSNDRGGGPKTKEQKRIEAERRKAKASQKDRIKTLIDKGEPGRLDELDGEVLQFAMELLEEKIAVEEEERSTLEDLLADPAFYYDSDKSATAVRRFEGLQQSLTTLYERWELVARLLEDERSNIEGPTP